MAGAVIGGPDKGAFAPLAERPEGDPEFTGNLALAAASFDERQGFALECVRVAIGTRAFDWIRGVHWEREKQNPRASPCPLF